MRKIKFCAALIFFLLASGIFAQGVKLEAYVFESGNRGYLNMVEIRVNDKNGNLVTKAVTDPDGLAKFDLPPDGEFVLTASKDLFQPKEEFISTLGRPAGDKIFLKLEMQRKPGYIFDVTIAEKREADDPTDAISGALIEVYNNTKGKEIMVLKNHPEPTFKCHFESGNHYTIMIRKKGFFNKRMEAYVDVEGCILCFDGVGEVKPGVSDVLTEGHQMGTLLANVELQPIKFNKAIKVENIYYDLNQYRLKTAARAELDKLILVLKDNPSLVVELGSHTDSRGNDKLNQRLSEKRAKAAVEYIIDKGQISPMRITSKGYGESKLVNSCGNGVECSEARHQKNRRTEIKITGLLAEDPYESKSLADIIEAEKMEALLKELENQEVVRVAPGEELPEEIRAQVEGKVEEVERVEEVTKVEGVEKELKTSEMVAEPKIKYSDAKIVSELEVEATTPTYIPIRLEDDFSGYMVEIYDSPYELPSSHALFQQHGTIYLENTKDGTYAYLLGKFEEWRDANKFLQGILSSTYANAKVVRYKKGKRFN